MVLFRDPERQETKGASELAGEADRTVAITPRTIQGMTSLIYRIMRYGSDFGSRTRRRKRVRVRSQAKFRRYLILRRTPVPSLNAIVWLVLCLIWGTTWIAIKIGLDDLPPMSFAAIRFLLATVILFVIVRVQRIPLPKTSREWRLLLLTGTLQFAINYSLVFWAEQYITSGLAAVLQANITVFGLILAWLFLPNERITKEKVIAVGLGVAGVVVIFADQLRVQSKLAFWASVGVVISAYSASQASVLIKAKGGAMHPATLVLGQMICGLAPIVAYGLIVEGNPFAFHWSFKALAAVLYLAIVGTVVAFWLFYWLLSRVESTLAMMISVVTPLVAVFIGWIVLDEQLPPRTALGGALIISGIALSVFRKTAQTHR
jgi:drug/metabolite transporter (DMT)-like permease